VNFKLVLISAGAALHGAIIGAIATLAATWLNKKLQYSGKVSLFLKIVHSKISGDPWGFYGNNNNLNFQIPVWLDVCNTSGVSRIIRNVGLIAYLGNKEVASFVQIQAFGDENRVAFGDNESYTLVVPSNSARRFQMLFALHENDLSSENKMFDEIVLRYYDERNCIHAFYLIKPEKVWVRGALSNVKDWITLDKKFKAAKH
jgi:hypothetical protein